MDINPELRRTSDSILAVIERLRALEQEKRKLPVGSPRFQRIAEEVEDLARDVLRKSEHEEHLGRRSADLEAQGRKPTNTATIADTPPPRDREVVLEEWTAAEQELASLDPDAPEIDEVRARARRLRDEWRSGSSAAPDSG